MSKKRKSAKYNTRQERRAERRGSQKPPCEYNREDQEKPRKRVKPRDEPVIPLTEHQADYDDAFKTHKVVFGIGPAGTGKTWFAAMRAAKALQDGEIERIIVTRPAETADEDMGFLPGELKDKYEPYLRPVKEAFEEFFGTGHLEYLLRNKIIEPIPLGFMRGATLKDCWVIADEMQNATVGQTKMLLTRFGQNAKFIINGDPKQVDIPEYKSGLMDAVRRTSSISDIRFVEFNRQDIVREGLVQDIVEAYERE